MKTKEIAALESYFKTESEHWNGFAFKMLCEVLQRGQFENPEIAMQLFNNAEDIITEHHKAPIQALHLFAEDLDKHKLSPLQKLFIYEWVCKYLSNTEYKSLDLTLIKELLESQKEKLKVESQPEKPLTTNMRVTLKDLFKKELDALPETLSKLEPEKRLNILIKLMPFIMPKVDSVRHEEGEPDEYEIKHFR